MIIGSKISISRNFKEFFFPPMLDFDTSKIITSEIKDIFEGNKTYKLVSLDDDKECEKLVALRVISNDFKNNTLSKALYQNKTKTVNMMINDNNHLVIKAESNSDKMMPLYDEIKKLEEKIDVRLPLAFDNKFGYLTSDLEILGTGMIPSYIVHIPMLELSNQAMTIKNASNKFGFEIKACFPNEQDMSNGGFYEISSIVTLGMSEREIISNLKIMVLKIIEKEKMLRRELYKKESMRLIDEVNRAWGILTNAKIVTFKEAEVLLSYLKLGISMKLFDDIKLKRLETLDVYSLLLNISDEYLKLDGNVNNKLEIDALRCERIREALEGI